MTYLNSKEEIVNILHAQGKSRIENHRVLMEIVANTNNIVVPNDLTIVSIWTDENKCIIKRQLDKYGVKIINAYIPDVEVKEWTNPYKIKCILNALKQVTTKYVLIVDGYDVYVQTFEGILDKFLKTGYKLLYNASKHNYPDVEIDSVMNRNTLGDYCYFNAGCCIGYTDYAKEFYLDCMKYIDIENPRLSELFIIRHSFANNKDKVFFDYKNEIFQTLGSSVILYIGENKCVIK